MVVGEHGTILSTTDGGANWVAERSGTYNTLYGVSRGDASGGTAVGAGGTILRAVEITTAVFITGFRADANEKDIVLSWSLLSDERIDGFELYRSGARSASERLLNDHPIEATVRSYVDETTLPGERYRYTLVVLSAESGQVRSAPVEASRSSLTLRLFQNAPNPFNPVTSIRYSIPRTSHVTLRIYSPAGRHVRTLVERDVGAGTHIAEWNGVNEAGTPVASGVYFYRLTALGFRQTKKMVLLK
jgi:hypothetical protein